MFTNQKDFHKSKDMFTSYTGYGKGESTGAKVVDSLNLKTWMDGEKKVTIWSTPKGVMKFRKIEKPNGPKDVFPPATYEIF